MMDAALTPQAVASFFLRAILASGDLRAAWAVTDEPLRRHFAVGWARDRAIDELSAIDPTHLLWGHFAQDTVDRFRESLAHVDLETWGWASDPRPVTIDREIVLLVDVDSAQPLENGDLACPGVEFTMRHGDDGWWVADVAVACLPQTPSTG